MSRPYLQGPQFGKVDYLVEMMDAKVVDQPVAFAPGEVGEETLVCVVSNAHFEAAAVCATAEDFHAFTYPSDVRPKVWLTIPTETVAAVSPEYREWLLADKDASGQPFRG